MTLLQTTSKKTTLAFDCSSLNANITLKHEDSFYDAILEKGTHAALLAPTIGDLLAQAGISMEHVQEIITPIGPGSFTGLRVALATAQGFLLARPETHNLKTCTSLHAMAEDFFTQNPQETECEIWFHAGKGEAATQAFQRATPLATAISNMALQPLSAIDSALSSRPLCGNIEGVLHPLAGVNSRILCEMAPHLPATPIEAAMPLYVRPADAKPPKPLPWLAHKA